MARSLAQEKNPSLELFWFIPAKGKILFNWRIIHICLVLEFAGQTIQREEGLKQVCDLKDPYISCCSQLCFSPRQKEASSTSVACSDSRLSGKTFSLKSLTWSQRAQTP